MSVEWKTVLSSKPEPKTNLGDILNMREFKLFRGLSKVSTMSFSCRLDNPMVPSIIENVAGYYKCYRNKTLLFHGFPLTIQEVGSGDDATLKVNCVGPEWRFTKMLIEKKANPPGQIVGVDYGEYLAGTLGFLESISKYEHFIEAVEAECHIGVGTTEGNPLIIHPYKLYSELLEELYDATGGFDWVVNPLESTANNNIGKLIIKAVIGATKENAVFEWGVGRKNIANFSRTIDRSTLLNFAVNFVGNEENKLEAKDVTSQTTYGRHDEVITAALLNTTLREKLINENIAVRKNPRQTITFEPTADNEAKNLPVFGTDFELGDSVRARIVYNSAVHFDALVRVWGAEFMLDENLKENQKLTLTNDA